MGQHLFLAGLNPVIISPGVALPKTSSEILTWRMWVRTLQAAQPEPHVIVDYDEILPCKCSRRMLSSTPSSGTVDLRQQFYTICPQDFRKRTIDITLS